ncbi:MAG: four helix bundle suffix domain-containing protein, partial [Candidatus Hydrogenedentes bacterium]|nr:four helix bundle suffix domain-containing protein [Candidatus Hydrogenedentota bacterium]
RQRRLPLWDKKDPRREALFNRRCATADEVAEWAREVHEREYGGQGPPPGAAATYAEIAANAALLLITVACSLLDRQITSLADAFQREGRFTERLYRARKQSRQAPGDSHAR